MYPNVTKSFKLQRPDLKNCRAEAMLRLFIAEHCFTVSKHATIWYRLSRTAMSNPNGLLSQKLCLYCLNQSRTLVGIFTRASYLMAHF